MAETWKNETDILASLVVGGDRAITAQTIRDAVYSILRAEQISLTGLDDDPTHQAGRVYYRGGTLNVMRDVSGVIANLPEEVQAPLATNVTGAQIDNGTAVYVSGSQGNRWTMAPATNADSSAERMIAVATHDISNGANGYCTTFGIVRDLDTDSWTEGTELYLGTAGSLTDIKPDEPARCVLVGHVLYKHPTQGEILVAPRLLRGAVQYAEVYWTTPASTTLAADTWAKASGTTTSHLIAGFSAPVSNRITHTDADTEVYRVQFDFSITAEGNNKDVYVGISLNGAAPSVRTVRHRKIGVGADAGMGGTHGLFTLAQNDYVEAWVKTLDGAEATITAGTLTATKAV